MDEHPNAALARQAYQAFGAGDLATVGELLDDNIVYHYPGRNPLAADYRGKEQVFGFFRRQSELCNGNLRVVPSAIAAVDEYAFALVQATAERNGRQLDVPAVHVSRIRDGKVVEFWAFTADQHAIDEFWS
jgi:ketosteroid isomerase-like protein